MRARVVRIASKPSNNWAAVKICYLNRNQENTDDYTLLLSETASRSVTFYPTNLAVIKRNVIQGQFK